MPARGPEARARGARRRRRVSWRRRPRRAPQTTPAGAAALAALGAQRRPAPPAERRAAGVALRGRDLARASWLWHAVRRSTRRGSSAATPLVVVADAIQNPGNLGGLLRTAEAAGATGAYLTEGSADPLSWKALRGSMGSAFRLPHVRGLDADAALDRVAGAGPRRARDRGRRRAALRRGRPARPGRDRAGQRRLGALRGRCGSAPTARLRIPLAAPVESLNVGVAAALVLFEAARQRGFARS